jgi:hypothetical protein
MNRNSKSALAFAIAGAMMAGLSASASSAGMNDVRVFQHEHAEAILDTSGPNQTDVTQMGPGGRVLLKVEGEDNETYAFSGMCPPGSPGRPIEVRGNHKLNIIIARCR